MPPSVIVHGRRGILILRRTVNDLIALGLEQIMVRISPLVVRCYAERIGSQWQAFALDFDLAAQGDSFEQARQKLDAMIRDYILEALVGDDRAHAMQLLSRRAPLSMWARYYWLRLRTMLRSGSNGEGDDSGRAFSDPIPLVPA
jgi:hypothetical protein